MNKSLTLLSILTLNRDLSSWFSPRPPRWHGSWSPAPCLAVQRPWATSAPASCCLRSSVSSIRVPFRALQWPVLLAFLLIVIFFVSEHDWLRTFMTLTCFDQPLKTFVWSSHAHYQANILGSSVGPLFFSLFYDHYASFLHVFILCLPLSLICAVAMARLTPPDAAPQRLAHEINI